MNPKLFIRNSLSLEGINSEIKDHLKELLTIPNPEWITAKNFGRYTGDIPKTIEQFSEEFERLVVPRGILEYVTENLGQEWDVVDERVAPESEKIWPEGKVVLRYNDQEPAVREVLNSDNGFLVAPAGSGKTVMGIEICRRLGLKALFLVHRNELKDQAIETAEDLFEIPRKKIGILHGPKWKMGEQLTVGMIPTLRKRNLEDIKNEFGVVMVDEAHHTPSSTFLNVVNRFNAKHVYGLTATAYRRDELDPVMFNAIGPKLSEIEHFELIKDEHLIIPTIHRINTGWNPRDADDLDYHGFMDAMVTDEHRNQLIVDKIVQECQDPKNTAAVLVNRTKHCENLTKMLKDRGIKCEFIASSVDVEPDRGSGKKKQKKKKKMIPKKIREGIVSDFKEGKIQVLIATYDLLAEGFNYRPLNLLFLATPIRWKGLVVQSVGRVQRTFEGKTGSTVFDYVDGDIAMFSIQADSRLSEVYRVMGMPVIDH